MVAGSPRNMQQKRVTFLAALHELPKDEASLHSLFGNGLVANQPRWAKPIFV